MQFLIKERGQGWAGLVSSSSASRKMTRCFDALRKLLASLFGECLSLPLSFYHFSNALVIVSDAPHDRLLSFVLKTLGDAENFFGAEAPVLRVFKIVGHQENHN